jgi:hypothetical protein
LADTWILASSTCGDDELRLLKIAESEKYEPGNAIPIFTKKNDTRGRGRDSGADDCDCGRRARAAKVAD